MCYSPDSVAQLWGRVLYMLLAFSIFFPFTASTLTPCCTRTRSTCVVGSCIRRHRDPTILATTFNALVTIFVQREEVIPKFFILLRDVFTLMD